MNHKRRRPKHQRAGCLWCKPWKDERAEEERASVVRAKQDDADLPELIRNYNAVARIKGWWEIG